MKNVADYESTSKRKSGIITLTLTSFAVGLMFIFGFTPPEPSRETEGLLVDFGYDAAGWGEIEPTVTGSTPPPPASQKKVAEKKILTQDMEESVVLPEKKSKQSSQTTVNNKSTKTNTNATVISKKDG